jgi:hypothetical protein
MSISSQTRGNREMSQISDHDQIFWVRSCLYVKSDSVHIFTEASSIALEILRANADSGASLQFDCRPMALPYPYWRRLEADYIHFCGRSLHQPIDVRLTTGNDLYSATNAFAPKAAGEDPY